MKLRPENYSFSHLMLLNPYMSNGVSHFNLLDELITWSDATVVMWRLIWICTVCQRSTKWRQGLNELNITPRVLEITSRNFRREQLCANRTRMYIHSCHCSSHIYILIQRHTFWNFIECWTYGYWRKALIIVVSGSHTNGRWPVHLNVYHV